MGLWPVPHIQNSFLGLMPPAFTTWNFKFYLNLCFVCEDWCDNRERAWPKEVHTIGMFSSCTIHVYHLWGLRTTEFWWTIDTWEFTGIQSKYKISNIFNLYTENEYKAVKRKIVKPIVPFSFSSSLLISKAKVEIIGRMHMYPEVKQKVELCTISNCSG